MNLKYMLTQAVENARLVEPEKGRAWAEANVDPLRDALERRAKAGHTSFLLDSWYAYIPPNESDLFADAALTFFAKWADSEGLKVVDQSTVEDGPCYLLTW